MADRDCYVAVDLGAESGRVIAGTPDQLEVVHRFPSAPVRIANSLYWDLPRIYTEVLHGLAAAFSRYPGRIISIAVDTWGVDYGLLDAQGDLIGLPYMYRDSRTDGVPERLFQRVSKREIFERTGIQFMQINTLFQLYAFAESKPELLSAAHRLLTMPDLMNYLLTGVKRNEYTIATTTQLFDPRTRDWAWELIDTAGLPRRLFGEPILPGVGLGPLATHVREAVGADQGVAVVATGCHDTASAVTAVPVDPAHGDRWAYLSSGTWSLLGIETPTPVINDASFEKNFTNEGASDGGIRYLKNIMGLWIVQECKRAWDREGRADGRSYSYRELVELAEAAGPAAFSIDPDDPQFLKPGMIGDSMPERIVRYCRRTGQHPPEGIGETVRGILESLARSYAESLAALEESTGRRIDALYIIGGGSQNELLNRLTAQAIGRPVFAGPVEATAVGNMIIQARAAGGLADIAQGRALVRRAYPITEYRPH